MRYFFRRRVPSFSRILLVESGSRHILESVLRGLYDAHPDMRADLVTCYAGEPHNFRTDRGGAYYVTDYPNRGERKKLYRILAENRYTIIAIICSDEPLMTKWKWVIAARLPAKVLVVNENADYFWLDWGHLSYIGHFILFRAGLTGAGAVRTLARLAVFPFALLYLVLYASTVHLRRKLRAL